MDSSRFLIIGANGQLGQALQSQYPNAQTADVGELDITNKESVANYNWKQVDVILNAAAFTNVDGAETADGRVAAWKVNAEAVKNLAHEAWTHGLTLVHISTDYVFDGTSESHTEDEPFSPISVYGNSKAAGDLLVSQLDKFYILRTSWVIGEGNNFVRTMLGVGNKGINPTVVADQIGRLTFTTELVRAIDHLLTAKSPFGTYNISNDGAAASWAEITREIYKLANMPNKVATTTTAEYFKGKENIAPRPLNSKLDLTKIVSTGFTPIDWREDLAKYIKKELGK